jgi:hypothetical protein
MNDLYFHHGQIVLQLCWFLPCCVPCHQGATHSQVADGEEGPQIWRIAANILNKQWTADKGWSSSLGVRRWSTTSHRITVICYEMFQSALDLD